MFLGIDRERGKKLAGDCSSPLAQRAPLATRNKDVALLITIKLRDVTHL